MRSRKPVIVCGDFDAKSLTWGAPHTYQRDELLEELTAAKQMVIANSGKELTFV